MINIAAINETLKIHRRLEFGHDVEITDHHKTKVVYDGGREWHFPYYVVKWQVGEMRYSLLLEPIVRSATKNYGWPTGPVEIYEEDVEAMRDELCRLLNQPTANGVA